MWLKYISWAWLDRNIDWYYYYEKQVSKEIKNINLPCDPAILDIYQKEMKSDLVKVIIVHNRQNKETA